MKTYHLCLLALTGSLCTEAADFQRHHIVMGLGAAVPQGDLAAGYSNAFAWRFGYGFRPVKFLQADFAYEGAYNAANVDDYVNNPSFGPLRIRDFQVFLPIGARVVAPLARGRVELYGGGGAAYMRYGEFLRQPSDWTDLSCPYCNARDGWGWYATAGFNVAVDRAQHFRIGAGVRRYQGETEGRPVGTLPAYRTKDRWLNTFAEFTFSF